MESKKRSLLKAITWKLLGFLILPIIALVALKNSDSNMYVVGTKSILILSIAYHTAMFMLFFVHERIWNKVKWGKKK